MHSNGSKMLASIGRRSRDLITVALLLAWVAIRSVTDAADSGLVRSKGLASRAADSVFQPILNIIDPLPPLPIRSPVDFLALISDPTFDAEFGQSWRATRWSLTEIGRA